MSESDLATILIVDDTPTNLEILVDYFAEAGFDIAVATSGEGALKQIANAAPDLILLDVMMPGMDGFETCGQLKSNPKTKDIPVIFMTALSETEDKVKGFTVGAVDYVTKPIKQEEVLARVRTHLTIRSLQQRLEENNGSLQAEILERTRTEKALQLYTKQLEEAQKENERLLLNILPESVAQQLKAGQSTIAERFQAVSVLFADLVGFTKFSSQCSPEALIEVLNNCFSKYDELADKYGLEKIKTLGDAYMVVGGIPTPRDDHAQAIVEMGLDIKEFIARYNQQHDTTFGVRIGINSGPAVAGVIGTKKFSYDVWGDTVNVASRMESHGLPHEIQVGESTYALLHDHYLFEERGPIDIKGKGTMKAYLLKGRRP